MDIVNQIGTMYKISLLGSSHGDLVGVTIEGLPVGLSINTAQIQMWLDRRRPGRSSITTTRQEKDKILIRTGIFQGKTNGQPLLAYIENKDTDSTYYEEIKNTPRPGHADYPAYVKYKGFNDYLGGGSFSGRMTAGIVIAGAIARQILKKLDIKIISFTKEIGGISADVTIVDKNVDALEVYDNPSRVPESKDSQKIEDLIIENKNNGDSIGGVVECHILNLPVGVGEPFFDSLESKIAHMIFSIPAVKGIEFGSGFKAARMHGSEHNDRYYFDTHTQQIKTETNNAAGILGGLSNGMPVVFRVAFKPTSSIAQPQQTVNRETLEKETLIIKGRHDPCIVPRAVPVVESAATCVILDLMLQAQFIKD